MVSEFLFSGLGIMRHVALTVPISRPARLCLEAPGYCNVASIEVLIAPAAHEVRLLPEMPHLWRCALRTGRLRLFPALLRLYRPGGRKVVDGWPGSSWLQKHEILTLSMYEYTCTHAHVAYPRLQGFAPLARGPKDHIEQSILPNIVFGIRSIL